MGDVIRLNVKAIKRPKKQITRPFAPSKANSSNARISKTSRVKFDIDTQVFVVGSRHFGNLYVLTRKPGHRFLTDLRWYPLAQLQTLAEYEQEQTKRTRAAKSLTLKPKHPKV
jgi:hypothetical protein